jgi:hypothetical protein
VIKVEVERNRDVERREKKEERMCRVKSGGVWDGEKAT